MPSRGLPGRSRLLLLLLLVVVAWRAPAEAAPVEAEELVYADSRGGMHFTQASSGLMLSIDNGEERSVAPGRARLVYEPAADRPYHVRLLRWEPLPAAPEPQLRAAFRPPMWGRRAIIAFLRLSDPDNASYCFTMAASRRYLHYLSMTTKLLTGNQADIDEANSFITTDCVPVNSTCYARSTDCLVNDVPKEVTAHYGSLFSGRPFSSRVFMAHHSCAHSGWVGLAAMSGNDAWTGGYNYWAIVRGWYSPPEDPSLSNYGVIVHEVGHNMGFAHANTGDSDAVGFIRDFVYVNGYSNYACYMGWGGDWWMIPDPSMFEAVVGRGSPIAHWFRPVEVGEHVYRLLAYEHPLSRLLLGVPEPARNDSAELRGLPYQRHSIGLFFNFTRADYNSRVPADVTQARVWLFWRAFSNGQISFGNRGLSLSIGRVLKGGSSVMGAGGNLLHARTDDIAHWDFSSIPLGYVSMPEQDVGTLSFQVLRFHHTPSMVANLSLVETPPLPEDVTLEEVPYAEVLIKSLPGVPFAPPTRLAPLPEIEFASSLHNCQRSGNNVTCDLFGAYEVYWAYIRGGRGSCRERSLPRASGGGDGRGLIWSGRAAVHSLRGSSVSNFFFYCGRRDEEVVRETYVMQRKLPENITGLSDHAHCLVARKPAGTPDSEYVVYPEGSDESTRWDAVVVRDLRVPEGGEAFIADLFHHRRAMTRFGAGGLALLEPFATQAFSDNVVTVTDGARTVGGSFFFRFRTAPTRRLAIRAFHEESRQFELVPADDSAKFSAPTLLERMPFAANLWHFFVFTRGDRFDYLSFDFAGTIPKDLRLSLETDNGVYSRRLWFLAGLSDVSWRVSFYDIHKKLGGWAEIYRFMVSQEVVLESIRVATASKTNDFPAARPMRVVTETLGNFSFRFNCSGSDASYRFEPFQASFRGTEYSFASSADVVLVTVTDLKDPLGDAAVGPHRRMLSGAALLLLAFALALL